jgi:signal transduction histidine kinase
MRNEDLLSIIIEDNGRGFDLLAVPPGGAGLGNVRSRVDYLHGVMDVRAEPGKGVSVHIECPLG